MQSTDYKFHRYKFDLVIDATSKHNLAAMAFNATDIKSFQYVLIVRAGLAVSERREMSKSEIEREVFIEFTEAVARCAIPSNLNGIMIRTTDTRKKNVFPITRIRVSRFCIRVYDKEWPLSRFFLKFRNKTQNETDFGFRLFSIFDESPSHRFIF